MGLQQKRHTSSKELSVQDRKTRKTAGSRKQKKLVKPAFTNYKGHLRGSQGSPLPKTESTESRGDNKAEGGREGGHSTFPFLNFNPMEVTRFENTR